MDVNDADIVAGGVRLVFEETGSLDVVVNNEGFGYGGSVEDTSEIDGASAEVAGRSWHGLSICVHCAPGIWWGRSTRSRRLWPADCCLVGWLEAGDEQLRSMTIAHLPTYPRGLEYAIIYETVVAAHLFRARPPRRAHG